MGAAVGSSIRRKSFANVGKSCGSVKGRVIGVRVEMFRPKSPVEPRSDLRQLHSVSGVASSRSNPSNFPWKVNGSFPIPSFSLRQAGVDSIPLCTRGALPTVVRCWARGPNRSQGWDQTVPFFRTALRTFSFQCVRRTQQFIMLSSIYCQLLIVVCIVLLTSEVVTGRQPLLSFSEVSSFRQ